MKIKYSKKVWLNLCQLFIEKDAISPKKSDWVIFKKKNQMAGMHHGLFQQHVLNKGKGIKSRKKIQ
jgi:hypothetical protein